MRKFNQESDLLQVVSFTEKAIKDSLKKFKSNNFILSYETFTIIESRSFCVACTIRLPEEKTFDFEMRYVIGKKSFFKHDRALKTLLLTGDLIFKKKFVHNNLFNAIFARRKGFRKEIKVHDEFLPQAKLEGVIVEFGKATERQEINGKDFWVSVLSGKLHRKIYFDVKSSKWAQEIHSRKFPNRSSIALSELTEYVQFKAMLMLVICEELAGRPARPRDKRCLF